MKCVFVGYLPCKKGYMCYHPSTQRFYVTINVTLFEIEMSFSSPISTSLFYKKTHVKEQN